MPDTKCNNGYEGLLAYLPKRALAEQPLFAIGMQHDLDLARLDLPVIQLKLMQDLQEQPEISDKNVFCLCG